MISFMREASLQLARAGRFPITGFPVTGCCSHVLVLLERALYCVLLACWNHEDEFVDCAYRPATARKETFKRTRGGPSHLLFYLLFCLFLHRLHGCEMGKDGTRDMCWCGTRGFQTA